ncbi:MAG: GNAT family N-acetyltransferase [Alphaproteobacteria bacterium]
MRAARRDFDRFDAICDHLLVLDGRLGDGPGAVVGTYRLMRGEVAARHGGFYSEGEFDLGALAARRARILELGRACVDARYRTRATMQRLWSGIADYVFTHDVGVMLGCASLPGTDPEALAPALSYLHHRHLAPPELRPRALPSLFRRMDLLPPEHFAESDAMAALEARAVVAGLPPLIKGYLRLGGFVGEGGEHDDVEVGEVVRHEQRRRDLAWRAAHQHAQAEDPAARGVVPARQACRERRAGAHEQRLHRHQRQGERRVEQQAQQGAWPRDRHRRPGRGPSPGPACARSAARCSPRRRSRRMGARWRCNP